MKSLLSAALLVLSVSAGAVEVKQPAPGFTLNAMTNYKPGQKVSLKDFRGKVVYLDFWASWCGPCKKSLPLLNDLRNKHKAKGFEVLAINLDEKPEDAIDFLSKHTVDYPIAADPSGNVPTAYNLKGMPTAFLIDKNGIVRKVHTGFKEKDIKAIEAEVTKLLK